MAATLRLTIVSIAAILFVYEAIAGARGNRPSPLYELIDLGIEGPTTDGGLWSEAFGINEAGAVVGHTSPGHAFVWTRRGGRQTLPELGVDALGRVSATGFDINNKGVIVGASTADGLSHRLATMWGRDRQPVSLGILGPPPIPGMLGSVAFAINDRGVVVGESTTAAPGYNHAFIWTKAAGMKDLGVLGADPFGNNASAAMDINNRGVIIGRTSVDGPREIWHAFAWTRRTGMVDIAPDWEFTIGFGMNNHNWTTGEGADADVPGGSVAVLWPGTLKVVNLGLGPAGFEESTFAVGFAVSDAGHVVGTMSSPVAPFASGFLWTRKLGEKVDLNELVDESAAGWRIVRAEDVNSRGQIVGSGCRLAGDPNCQVQRALVLNPKRAR